MRKETQEGLSLRARALHVSSLHKAHCTACDGGADGGSGGRTKKKRGQGTHCYTRAALAIIRRVCGVVAFTCCADFFPVVPSLVSFPFFVLPA